MGQIIEASQLPQTDKVYLKKDFLGYRIVHPWSNPETGKLNWFNICTGGWRNLITIAVVVLFLLWVLYDTNNQIKEYKEYCEPISKDPVKFCEDIGFYDAQAKLRQKPSFEFNVSSLKLEPE